MFNTLNRNVYPNWWWNQIEPDYLNKRKLRNNNNQLLSKSLNLNNKKEISNKNKNKNYFSLKNKTNYKISYDKNLNVIKVETGQKRKIKNNK